jgi:ketosteroid isomerase-like protein
MRSENSRSFVQDAFAAFASRDPARIRVLFNTDTEWFAPPGNATAIALNAPNHMVGAEAITAFIATDMRRLFHDVSIKFRGFHADGPVVIVEMEMSAELPDGRPYLNDYCFVFECRSGGIFRVREYMDTLKGHEQLFPGGRPLDSGLADAKGAMADPGQPDGDRILDAMGYIERR